MMGWRVGYLAIPQEGPWGCSDPQGPGHHPHLPCPDQPAHGTRGSASRLKVGRSAAAPPSCPAGGPLVLIIITVSSMLCGQSCASGSSRRLHMLTEAEGH